MTARGELDLVLGRYRKKSHIGTGGQAEIWLAENVEDRGCDVVLKIYPLGSSMCSVASKPNAIS